ncbi:MAG: translation initiation factor IF-2 [Alphaproteobacteria bacterium]
MSDSKDDKTDKTDKPLSLSGEGRLGLRRTSEQGQVRQSFSHGRSKTVQVEVRRKRTSSRTADSGGVAESPAAPASPARPAAVRQPARPATARAPRGLTEAEREARVRAVQGARTGAAESEPAVDDNRQEEIEATRRRREEEERRRSEVERRNAEEEARRRSEEEASRRVKQRPELKAELDVDKAGDDASEARRERPDVKRPRPTPRTGERRRSGKLTIAQALDEDAGQRARSLASVRRARERDRLRAAQNQERVKIVRDVTVPDSITVQELSNRMAEKAGDVIKFLMKNDMMATITQSIDADTAELVVNEFGHKFNRVSEADVEIGIDGLADVEGDKEARAPVVTVMGHVDHGKTSLLDALRETDVVAREAGGITQHIGAYQVRMKDGRAITFVDTPGHAAFTEMRARGASITDLVVLVVAADDGVQPQTAEAISHARAAGVPMIVAINKTDAPGADASRVRNELLNHEVVTESNGGDVLAVEISALKKQNLDALEEAILLQAEVLELTANPDRPGQGAVIEAKLDRGRGPVATVLVQRGTLRTGDIVIAGDQWGKVRALQDFRGEAVDSAGPSMPVEILGLNGVPEAGDDFAVVENESRAREVSEFRQRRRRDSAAGATPRSTVQQMLDQISAGEVRELPVVVKADVQGSVEAIANALASLGDGEVAMRIIHAGVGAITESDVTLAASTGGLILGFGVRPNPQAREAARRDGVDIRYYAIIYELVDEMRGLLSGMLAPREEEKELGHAEVREVFAMSKTGKVAGCMVTDGLVRRGARARLLRDGVVVHATTIEGLRRFKDEVREVNQGFECGISLANYQDIQQGDVIEVFEIEQISRQLAS